MKILLVEDEPELGQAITRRLRAQGYAVDVAGSCEDADGWVRRHDYRVVVLDRSLPDGDGVQLLRRWRAGGRRTPVLILTARDAVEARVEGLEAGADDYLIKPFAMGELLARIRSISRREAAAQPPILVIGDLQVNTGRAEVRRAGVLLPLRAKEYAVLLALCERRGRVISRERLRALCWDDEHEPGSNVEEVTISALRRKLGPPNLIETRRGLGYLLDP